MFWRLYTLWLDCQLEFEKKKNKNEKLFPLMHEPACCVLKRKRISLRIHFGLVPLLAERLIKVTFVCKKMLLKSGDGRNVSNGLISSI